MQIALELNTVVDAGTHGALEALHGSSSALFGAVHRRVGMRDERLDALAVLRIKSDADAGRGMHVDLCHPHGRLQHLHHAIRQSPRVVRMIDRGHQQHELIAADACDRIGGTYQSRQAAGDLLQELIAGCMSQGIVHEFEAVEIAHHQRERPPIAVGPRHRLRQTIIEEYAIGQPRERIVRGEMPQLAGGGLEPAGARTDHLLELMHLLAHQALVMPFARQRGRALQDLDGLRRLAQHQQLIGMIESLDHFRPVIVGVRRADHDLHVGIDPPKLLDGLQAIPARRHPHVDEGHGIRSAVFERRAHHREALLSLIGGVDLKIRAHARALLLAEKIRFELGEGLLRTTLRLVAQYLAKIAVD